MSDHSFDDQSSSDERFRHSASSLSSCSDALASSRVQFSTVSIRRYARTISDHPEARGVPIGIDWDYLEESPLTLDDYETQKRVVDSTKRKPGLRLTSITRENVLKHVWGYSSAELLKAEQEARKVSRLRQRSARGGWVESMRIQLGV
ncbi:hypothetical protein MHU86_12018 [Fragilaria crotonensis]|nr:hypothetical protein MHU86_12018 [Fragilaria crotonensis]